MIDEDSIQGQESLNKFLSWSSTLSDEDFVAISRGSKLHRGEVRKGAGIGKSTINDNVLVRNALIELERDLRKRGILAPLVVESPNAHDTANIEVLYNQNGNELKRLRVENQKLQEKCLKQEAEIARLREFLEKYDDLADVLAGSGIMPR